jgi:hypothetical protein
MISYAILTYEQYFSRKVVEQDEATRRKNKRIPYDLE